MFLSASNPVAIVKIVWDFKKYIYVGRGIFLNKYDTLSENLQVKSFIPSSSRRIHRDQQIPGAIWCIHTHMEVLYPNGSLVLLINNFENVEIGVFGISRWSIQHRHRTKSRVRKGIAGKRNINQF